MAEKKEDAKPGLVSQKTSAFGSASIGAPADKPAATGLFGGLPKPTENKKVDAGKSAQANPGLPNAFG